MPQNSHNPPDMLDGDLEVGPDDWQGRAFYFLMNALVVPRPIGWMSTLSASGVKNLAPYSHFNLMGSNPFYLAFASTGVKDTITNLRAVPEFVANIVSIDLLERMNFTSCDFPPEEEEFGWAGLTPVPAAKVQPPRVGEAKAHLECAVAQIYTDGNTNIVLARILHAHVDPAVWRDGRVDPRLLNPAGRLSGSGYAALGDLVNVQRPEWQQVRGTRGQEAMPREERR
ncbi:MAG TPA: flavin reductase family protein [Stellaceae bacterium]|nr:flavin reductase family protein [Stellaceae bacterium]